MARIKFGMMMTDARGKLGGQVFSKNRSGAIVRTKVTPRNPQTFAQASARSRLGSFSSGWASLTEEMREGWNSAAAGVTLTNVFGDAYNPSGKNYYVMLNSNLEMTAQTPVTSVPPFQAPGTVLTALALVDATEEEFDILFTTDDAGTSSEFVYLATKPGSPGIYNFSGKYVQIATTVGRVPVSPASLWTAYVARFGVPLSGQKIGFGGFLVSPSGATSPRLTGATIVIN